MKPELLHILQHSLGVNQYGQGRQYRNHFATSPETTDWPLCIELCRLGLMKENGPVEMWEGMHCFRVTEEGRKSIAELSPKPPKLTRSKRRYLEYLEADTGRSFKDWITTHP